MVSKITSRLISLTMNGMGGRLWPSQQQVIAVPRRTFRVTSARNDLMEFFDDKKNWGEREVKVGRSWKIDELRLKSNVDLHKLWYILLKEKNMLLTMELDAKTESKAFPNPERIDKVEESMKNLEEVVRERNRAYFLLETGKTGERTGEEVENWIGLPEYREHKEYPVPKEENREWWIAQEEEPKASPKEKTLFFSMLREKQKNEKLNYNRFERWQIYQILKKFPDVDKSILTEKFPTVDEAALQRMIDRIKDRTWVNTTEPWAVSKWRGQHSRFRRFTWRRWYGLGRR